MCLTIDGIALDHVQQVDALTEAGAKLIQLRMKQATPERWLATAKACVTLCHARGAKLIVNDSAAIALASEADGVHLGKTDGAWSDARTTLGEAAIIGGTVNNEADARLAAESGVLNYVGVGPFRFTTTKAKLAPVLGKDGIVALLPHLGALPAWAIGGIEADDVAALGETPLSGVAVSSALFRGDSVPTNFQRYLRAWRSPATTLVSS